MIDTFSFPQLEVAFTFRERPTALPPDFRPEWRMAIVVLILYKNCSSTRSSLTKLHLINWSIRNERSRNKLFQYLDGRIGPGDVIIRHEPGLNRALEVAIGERLVESIAGNRVVLTSKGVNFAQEIDNCHDCMVEEKHVLNILKKSLTEKRVQELMTAVNNI